MRIQNNKKIYSPTELNYFAKENLEQMTAWVEGEVSEFKKHPSFSFYYLTLKDDKSILPCVASGTVFKNSGDKLLGKKVIVYGNLTIYEPYAKYQMRLYQLDLSGEGEINKKLAELTQRLREEGLFDASNKKSLPKYPKSICLVTSKNSDAWRDFVTHSTLKFPIIEIKTIDTRVQGSGSVENLLKSLQAAESSNADVVVLTRGGGSLEDLAAFNDEKVARTIYAMETPTIVAIGHESNESLAEFVADVRASTPTDAANIVTAAWQTLLDRLGTYEKTINSLKEKIIDYNLQKLDYIYSSLLASKTYFELTEQHLNNLENSLKLLSIDDTLNRGFAVVLNKKNQIINSAENVIIGSVIGVKFAHNSLKAKVTQKKYDKKFQ